MMRIAIVCPLFLLAGFSSGCATNSRIMTVGPETFLITVSADAYRGGIDNARQVAFSEAEKYCVKNNKLVVITNSEISSFVDGGQTFDVTFHCEGKKESK